MKKRFGHFYTSLVMCVSIFLFSCGDKQEPALPFPDDAILSKVTSDPHSKDSTSQLRVKLFADARDALADVLLRTNPTIIGLGEFHQQNDTVKTVSALERFRVQLLPLLGPSTSDLIVETWVPKGCGKVEKKVIQEVEKVTERPKETENETVRLLNSAKELGVTPHILDVTCEQYEGLFDTDSEMDFLAMLELVGTLLGDTARKALAYRKENPAGARQRVLIYGGAIHNDVHPSDIWRSCSYGVTLKKRVSAYIAVDLYVPEFIEGNDLVKKEPWYSLYKENVSAKMVVLIEKAPDSFIIIFKKGVVGG